MNEAEAVRRCIVSIDNIIRTEGYMFEKVEIDITNFSVDAHFRIRSLTQKKYPMLQYVIVLGGSEGVQFTVVNQYASIWKAFQSALNMFDGATQIDFNTSSFTYPERSEFLRLCEEANMKWEVLNGCIVRMTVVPRRYTSPSTHSE